MTPAAWREMSSTGLLLLGNRVVLAGVVVVLVSLSIGGLIVRGGPSSPVASAGNEHTRLPPGQPLDIAWGGDLTLGSAYGVPPRRGRPLLAAVRDQLRNVDVAAVNLEGTLGRGGTPKCAPREGAACFAFQAPPPHAETLHHAGVDVVNLANNHAWDYGAEGMGQTVRALRRYGVKFTGRPGEIRYLKRSSTRVAMIGFSSYPWTAPIRDLTVVQQLVSAAAGRANIVVVFMHAGAEGDDQTRTPDADEEAYGEQRGNARAFARAAIDAGADLVLGSGPHVLRGLEVYRGRLVAYSLGNLAGWKNFSLRGNASISGLLRVRIGANGRFVRGHLLPLRLRGPGVPERDPKGAAGALVARVSREDFGTRAPRVMEDGVLRPR